MENYQEDGFPFIPKSNGMSQFLYGMDGKFFRLEEEVKFLKEENKKLNNELCENVNRQLKEGQDTMGNALLAMLAPPSIDVMNPAGAIILMKIREMKSIKEVHQYIDSIKEKSLQSV